MPNTILKTMVQPDLNTQQVKVSQICGTWQASSAELGRHYSNSISITASQDM
jgi:hypothetical protein